MKILLCILIFLISALTYAQKPDLIPYRKGLLWGYSDSNAKIVIQPKYDKTLLFYEGRAKVIKDKKVGFIDKKGEEVVPIIYDKATRFHNGLAVVKKDKKYGYINKSGKVIIPIKYDFASRFFYPDRATVKKGDNYIIIDNKGEIIVDPEYDWVSYISESGYAWVNHEKKNGLIDKSGNEIVPPIFKEQHLQKKRVGYHTLSTEDKRGGILINNGEKMIYYYMRQRIFTSFEEKRFFIVRDSRERDAKCLVVNEKGEIILKTDHEFLEHYTEGIGVIADWGKKGIQRGYINSEGTTIVAPKYDKAGPFSGGLGRVILKNKYGFVDMTGKFKIPMKKIEEGIELSKYQNGLMIFIKDGKKGLMNYEGEIVMPAGEQFFTFLNDKYISYYKDNKRHFMDYNVKIISQNTYKTISFKPEYGYLVKSESKYGVLDFSLNEILPVKFDKIEYLKKGYYRVKKDNKEGYYNLDGTVKFPIKYSKIRNINDSENLWVKESGRWKMVNLKDEQIHDKDYSKAGYFSHGYYYVYDGKFGIVNPEGKLILDYKYKKKLEGFWNNDLGRCKKRIKADGETHYVKGYFDKSGLLYFDDEE